MSIVTQNLFNAAQQAHQMGFNVVAQSNSKRAIHTYARFSQQRQTAADIKTLPWKQARRIALILGPISDNLICLDLDHQPDRQALDAVLLALDLPLDYPWHETTPNGGQHVYVRAPGLELERGQKKYDRPGIHGGHIELRAHGILATLYQLAGDMPTVSPAVIDPDRLIAAYEAVTLPPVPKPAPERTTYHAPALGSDASELEEIERRARQAIANGLIKRGQRDGYYGCPQEHGQEGKDFLFSPEPGAPIGGCQGKHAGQLTRWVDLAAHLHIDVSQIARDVALEQRGTDTPYSPLINENERRQPDLTYDQPRDPDVRLQAWHYTRELQRRLLNLYAETDSRGKPRWPDLPDLALGVMVIGVITEKEKAGELPLGAWLTEADIMELSGLRRQSCRSALQLVTDLGIFCRKRYCEIKGNTSMYHFRQKIESGRGKRGPAYVYMLRDQDIALDWMVETIADNALRTATFRPEGGDIIPDHFRTTPAYGLTLDEWQQAEIQRQPLYEQFAAERARAEKRIRRMTRVLRQQLHAASQGYHDLAVIPDEPTPNKARYRDALDERRRLEENPIGIRVESTAKTCAAVGFKDRQALRRSRERRLLVTDKQYKPKTLQRGDVLGQLPESVVNRGWGLRLEASNGDTFEVTTKSRPYAENWAERQFSAGCTVTAQMQTVSLERAATTEEIKALEARHEKRLERQRERVRAYAANPRPVTPANDHSAAYVTAQARLSLPEHFTENEGVLLNTRTGESWGVSPQVLCQAVAGSLGRKEREEMSTHAAHIADALEARESLETVSSEHQPSLDSESSEHQPSLSLVDSDARTYTTKHGAPVANATRDTGQLRATSDQPVILQKLQKLPVRHACHVCGSPAHRLTGKGWECDDCNDQGAIIALQNIRAWCAQHAAVGD